MGFVEVGGCLHEPVVAVEGGVGEVEGLKGGLGVVDAALVEVVFDVHVDEALHGVLVLVHILLF